MKKILLALLAVLVIIQFFRPEKNLSGDNTFAVQSKYPMPEDVAHILEVACNDCHSNLTRYPWYAEVQPIAWWLNYHVVDGKRKINYSQFTNRPLAYQNHKLEETIDMLKEDEMPLPSYTWLGLHSDAKLSPEQKETLIKWAQDQMDYLKATYPADSLVLRRRQPQPGSS